MKQKSDATHSSTRTEKVRAVLAAVFLSLVLSACGGGGGGNGGSGMMPDSGGGGGTGDGSGGGGTMAAMMPTAMPSLPATFSEGSTAHVYAQSASDTIGSHRSPLRTLSTNIRREWGSNPNVSLSGSGNHSVSRIDRDNLGDTYTFVIDGEEVAITFPPGDYQEIEFQGDEYWKWNVVLTEANPFNIQIPPQYYDLSHWGYCAEGPCYDGAISYGIRTMTDDFPVGTVNYHGYIQSRV